MKKIILTAIVMASISSLGVAQTLQADFYNVDPVPGNGIRFWSSDNYKIGFSNTWDYNYGPVRGMFPGQYEYAIKMNMSSTFGRGWVWGVNGQTPIAALSNYGRMQIKEDFYTETGNIGIGSLAPADRLQIEVGIQRLVFGALPATSNNNWGASYMGFNASRASSGFWKSISNGANNGGAVIYSSVAGNLYFATIEDDGTTVDQTYTDADVVTYSRLIIKKDGNVGIGTDKTTGYKLSVEGKIRAREIEVNASTWADYVFEKNYELASLNEVENYIEKHKHLPNVPSAEQVEEEGINLGEMDAILLRKIEELTLYVIELEKRIAEKE